MKRAFKELDIVQNLESQDAIVVAYIEALEIGDKDGAKVLKMCIRHISEKVEFDFSCLETIAIYAHLLNKTNAYNVLRAEESILSDFIIPTNSVALLCAARYGYAEMIKLLMQKNHWNNNMTALCSAVENAHLSAMRVLLTNIQIDDKFNCILMQSALKHHNIDGLKILLSHRVMRMTFSLPPTLFNESISIIRSLAAANVEVEDVIFQENIGGLLDITWDALQRVRGRVMAHVRVTWDDVIWEAISSTAPVGEADMRCMVKELVKSGEIELFKKVSNAIDLSPYGDVMLEIAIQNKNLEIVKHLFSSGIKPKSRMWDYFRASIAKDDVNIFQYLSEVGKTDLTQCDKYSLLEDLIYRDAIEIAKFLVNQGFDLAIIDEDIFKELVINNAMQILKYFVSLNIDIKPFVVHAIGYVSNPQQLNICRYLFTFLDEKDFLDPKVMKAASCAQDVQSLEVLVAKGAKIDSNVIDYMANINNCSFKILQFIASQNFDITSKAFEFVKKATSEKNYHINWYLSSSLKIDVISIIEKGAANRIAFFNAQDSISYIKRMTELAPNVNPLLRNIDPEKDDVLSVINVKCNAIFEMVLCAMECPTEVLSLIASQILGIDCAIVDLMSSSGLRNISIPREIECYESGYSKASLRLLLLYERNQIISSGVKPH